MRAVMSNELFVHLSEFIYNESGIRMPLSKKTMLEARLMKRLRNIGLSTLGEYCNYLFSPEGIANELVHMIDVVTTNKTDFFREPQHFEYVVEHAIPNLIKETGQASEKPSWCGRRHALPVRRPILSPWSWRSSRKRPMDFTIWSSELISLPV
jgi:chemotaxis protein methyltransferase CheR